MTSWLPEVWCPPADQEAVGALVTRLRASGVPVRENQPLARWTTLGVGGAARAFVEPADGRELGVVLAALATTAPDELPLLVVGRGSNMLVGDRGWPGLALRLGAGFKWYRRDGLLVSAGGGAAMPALAAWAATEGLTGLEFAAGIPATVGGSVRMNAGAHGQQTADRLVSVELASDRAPQGGRVDPAALGFAYRHSVLPPRSVVTAATWQLEPDDPAAVRTRLDEHRAWRRDTQPLRQRNCGSVFTNPAGDSAGRIVDAAGLKGRRRGGAAVSEKHANFIVVEPGATAADVALLVAEVRAAVAAAGGPVLRPEVRLVGDFGDLAAAEGVA